MKWLRHIVSCVVWVVVGLYLSLFVLLHLSSVQQKIGSAAAGVLSEKLGTSVSIGQVNVGLFNRVVIDDATILDQSGRRMFQVARMSVRIKLLSLFRGQIAIASAQMFGADIRLYQASATAKPNYQFILDSLASKDPDSEQGPIDFHLGSFIMRRSSVSYDRLDVAPRKGIADMTHIGLSGISANIQVGVLTDDSVNLKVKKLAFKERSGFSLNKLSLAFEAGKNGGKLSDFELETPYSHISIPYIYASYTLKNGLPDIATATYKGQLDESVVSAVDVGKFVELPATANASATLSATVHGREKSAVVPLLDINTSFGATLKAKGRINWDRCGKTAWHADLQRLFVPQTAWKDISNTFAPKQDSTFVVLQRLGDITVSGNGGREKRGQTVASVDIVSGAGTATIGFSADPNDRFHAYVKAENTDLGRILNDKRFGNVQTEMNLDGSLKSKAQPEIRAKGTLAHFTYNGYEYKNIDLDGSYGTDGIGGQLAMNDPNGSLDIKGNVKKVRNATDFDLKASVKNFSPKGMKLTDRWGNARFSATMEARVTAKNVANAIGRVTLSDFRMEKADSTYELKEVTVTSGRRGDQHFIAMTGDIGHAEMVGKMDFGSILQSVADFARGVLPTLPGLPHRTKHASNDFLVNAEITRTDWIETLLQVPFRSKGTISLNGKLSDTDKDMYLNCTAQAIHYGGQDFEDVSVAVTAPEDALHADIKATKVLGDDGRLRVELSGNAHDNRMETSLQWSSDDAESFRGVLNADALFQSNRGATETEVRFKPSSITVGNAEWTVRPARVTFSGKRINVEDFAITHDKQHIMVNGMASADGNDSLLVDLNDIDVAYILNLVDFDAVDFAGQASGKARITDPLGNLGAEARLIVKNFTFEHGRMGTLHANVNWNKKEKQIDIDAIANDGADAMTLINGYVSPPRNYIDLNIKAVGTHIDFARSFTGSFMDKLDGHANGGVRLHGPLDEMDLTGKLVINGECNISTTGCAYTLDSDTLRFKVNEIEFANAHITDIYGHSGWINGGIHHDHLSNLSYDIGIESDEMLVYDFKNFGDDTFYGTVFGSGSFDIHGNDNGVTMDMDVTPLKNTTFVYNASTPDGISGQEFITWKDRNQTVRQTANGKGKTADESNNRQQTSDLRINFALNMTPNATIKLLMDSKTNDYITLNGTGTLRATYYNKGAFNIYGTYNVVYGTYGVTIQNIIKKNFTFNEGGTIVFRGNPYDADLNLQAVYTVNGVSLSDLNIGNSFSNNTIKVNCLMNISGQPSKPVVDFGMDMPTVSSDEVQMIRNVINSEDEMNQQVLYLLGIGRFYPQGNNNSTAQDERQQSQTSLAMQSLLSGTLSSQINNVLSTVIKSNNWNFGANISTGDEGWNNAEYEGLLSGKLLNNRLLINGQFGYRDNASTARTSFIGDFDIRYLLLPNGNIAIKMYNETNDRYFTKSSLNTQGIGLILKKDFGKTSELFKKDKEEKKTKKTKGRK